MHFFFLSILNNFFENKKKRFEIIDLDSRRIKDCFIMNIKNSIEFLRYSAIRFEKKNIYNMGNFWIIVL